jgi:hypothetical protein
VLLPATRLLLMVFGALTALAFLALFVMAAHTDRYFAWTIAPSATAAFLGGAYGAGCVGVALGLWSGRWPGIRVPYVGILAFTVVTLIATLRQLDRFHFDSSSALARFAAWLWLGVYVLIPIAMLAMLLLQERRTGAGDHERAPLPVQLLTAVQSVVLLAVGAILFAEPASAQLLWPWPLTPLTARMVAAWLIGFGIALALGVRRTDRAQPGIAAAAYAVLATLELVVVLRYPGVVRWSSPAAWVYLLLATTILGVSLYTILRARPDTRAGANLGVVRPDVAGRGCDE